MTLKSLRDNGDRITLYCAEFLADQGRWCSTGWEPGFEQMIQYFGLEFEISSDRARFLAMFECPNCGAPAHSLTLSVNAPGMMRGMNSHNHVDTRTPEQKAQDRHDAIEIPKMVAEHLAWVKEQRRRNRAAEKAKRDRESGRDPIGPPNPWAHRKGRWL